MTFELAPLPYSNDALMPHMSPETLHFHHGKHHKGYVDKLNELISGTEFEKMGLEEIMKKATGPIFNNAAQIWNHTFFWNCLAPKGGGEPNGPLREAIIKDFGSVDSFKEKFNETAVKTFGSGWTWLVKNKSGKLEVISTANAECPITEGQTPLLTADVWEHAYYIDYRNDREKFLAGFWNLVNWKWAESQISRS